MGRPRRDFHADIYHVAAHASDNRHLFLGESDRREFLDRLDDTFWRRDVALLAYVLLGNHYHALVWIPDARLSEALQRLHTEYSRAHNRAHGRTAHLFRAHCLARRIADDFHLLTAYRYLARNPVDAGLVASPLDWPWSSARAHAGVERSAIRLSDGFLRSALGPSWRESYARLIGPDDGAAAATTAAPVT